MNSHTLPRSFAVLSVLALATIMVMTGCMGVVDAQDPVSSGGVVAYGFVTADASIASGTMNVKRGSYNPTGNQYEIPIDGIDFYYRDFTAVVTPSSSKAIMATTSSVDGKLVVMLSDHEGMAVQGDFSFVIYR